MSRIKNTDPFQVWNDPMHRDDPFAPHNDPMREDDPSEKWNDPMGRDEDLSKKDKSYYRINTWEDEL